MWDVNILNILSVVRIARPRLYAIAAISLLVGGGGGGGGGGGRRGGAAGVFLRKKGGGGGGGGVWGVGGGGPENLSRCAGTACVFCRQQKASVRRGVFIPTFLIKSHQLSPRRNHSGALDLQYSASKHSIHTQSDYVPTNTAAGKSMSVSALSQFYAIPLFYGTLLVHDSEETFL